MNLSGYILSASRRRNQDFLLDTGKFYYKMERNNGNIFPSLDGRLFEASKLEKAKLPNSLRSNSGNFFHFCFTKKLYKKPPYMASVNMLPILLFFCLRKNFLTLRTTIKKKIPGGEMRNKVAPQLRIDGVMKPKILDFDPCFNK